MTENSNTKNRRETYIIIVSVFIAGLCSIVYELLISTASSYFWGDSIKQFSITIGLYMASMGLGSFVSRLFKDKLMAKFIGVEIILGFLGGISIPALYAAYAYTDMYYTIMVLLIISIGLLIGLEIPLLTRIMERYYTLKINISNVLSLDYLGALIATLLFPFILLPLLGTFRSSLFFGTVNMGIGFMNIWGFKEKLAKSQTRFFFLGTLGVTAVLLLLFLFSPLLLSNWSNKLYDDPIIYSKQTKYQNVVITRRKEDVRLFINGNVQFSSLDEYRYHEALIHVPLGGKKKRSRVLVLGGGDGLAARELLKYPDVKEILLVDLDPEIINISRSNPYISKLNQGSLDDSRVTVINQDAFVFLDRSQDLFDLIVSDLPDPNNVSLSRLYSREFYRLVRKHLDPQGLFVVQSTSPYFANKSFWTIHNTLKAAGFYRVYPYHVYLPSFGDWGFNLASLEELSPDQILIEVPTRFLTREIIPTLFVFGKDLRDKDVAVNTLDDPKLLHFYLSEWRYWN